MDMLKIQGRYLSGKTSKQQLACLEVLSDKTVFIETLDPKNRILINHDDIQIESRLGNTPREIYLGDNQLFITDDNDSTDNLSRIIMGKNSSLLHRLESNLLVIAVALVVTVLFVFAGTRYGVPKTAEMIAHEFPSFTSEKFNNGLSILDQSLFEPSQLTAEEKQRIAKLFQPFLIDHSRLSPRVHFRGGFGPNAFALPNGDIVFTDEFVALADNDNELIAVLFHELGHLEHKHMARRAIQDAMMVLMTLFIIGDLGSADLVTGIPTLLLDLSYSRDFEREADLYAVQQLAAADIPVESFATIMQKLHDSTKAKGGDESSFKFPSYLSTHPQVEERIDVIKKINVSY